MEDEIRDVVVIGAGVCGALAAWRLAGAGARVLMLEAGELSPPRVELVGAYASAAIKSPGSPYKGREGDIKAPSPDGETDYYVQGQGDHFKSTYERRVGGSTWHWLGNVPRLLPNDFRMKTIYGVGADWPIAYSDLEEDYSDAEHLLGVSGDHEQWNGLFGAYRSRPYPMTKVWESYSDRKIAELLRIGDFEGVPLKIMNTPQARNSQPYDERPVCAGNSICVPICPIQAKYDATVHVKKAQAKGAELQPMSVVTRLELDGGSSAVARVVFKTWDKQEHSARARLVVLAAHAIETPKILLMSGGQGGIANSSGQVGRNLMDHLQGEAGCISPEPLFPFRGPPTTSGIDAFRDGDFRKYRAAFRMSLGNNGWGRLETPVATLLRLMQYEHLFGAALQHRVAETITSQFRISYSTEMLPRAENRVTLASEKDGMDLPRPQLQIKVDDYNQQAFAYARRVIQAVFDGIGGSGAQFQSDYSGAGHIMGTCRMGDDPKHSVVNSYCRSHDHPNLFIVGASAFPTCGTANPTLTAAALTLRSVREIQRSLTLGEI